MKRPVLVIKVGGNELDDQQFVSGLITFVEESQRSGRSVAVVHGGGRFIEDLQSRLQLTVQKVDGLRVTTPESMQAVRMALIGIIGQDLCLALQNRGIPAAALSAFSGLGTPCLRGRKKPPMRRAGGAQAGQAGDLGLVGEIEEVDTRLFDLLIDAGIVPVIAPPAIDADAVRGWLNVNADEAAASIAASLGAQELAFMTNVPGVLVEGQVQTRIDTSLMDNVLGHPDVSGGMIPKLKAAARAAAAGVGRVGIGSLASFRAGNATRITAGQHT